MHLVNDLRQLRAHLADLLDAPPDFLRKLVHPHHAGGNRRLHFLDHLFDVISRHSGLVGEPANGGDDGRWSAFRQGIVTNLLNPKVALFFLALMPQFISADSNHKVAAFIALGVSFMTLGLAWCLVLAIGASSLRALFLRRPSMASILNKVAGSMFIALGIRLATARQ